MIIRFNNPNVYMLGFIDSSFDSFELTINKEVKAYMLIYGLMYYEVMNYENNIKIPYLY